MRTRFTRRAHAFQSPTERGGARVRTRFDPRADVLVLVRTRFTCERTRFGPCANAFHMRINRVSLDTYLHALACKTRYIPYI